MVVTGRPVAVRWAKGDWVRVQSAVAMWCGKGAWATNMTQCFVELDGKVYGRR